MCCRYYVEKKSQFGDLLRWLDELDGEQLFYDGEIHPGDPAPVIAKNRAGALKPFVMQWGFSLPGQAATVFNARSETAAQKPLFAQAYASRRCIILAEQYYEWKQEQGRKQKYSFRTGSGLYIAGIYRNEAKTGKHTFTMLTQDASPDVAAIHDRMPVILSHDDISDWIVNGKIHPERTVSELIIAPAV